MAQKTSRERRAEHRATRRAASAEEMPDVDAAVDSIVEDADEQHSSGDALKTAASAALAAAAVGAARALVQRRHHEPGADPDMAEDDDGGWNGQGAVEPDDVDVDAGEPFSRPEPVDEAEHTGPRDAQEPERREAAPPGRALAMIDAAKQHLRDLRGAEAEAVSSVRRTSDGWQVALDVVEVHRVPESTDVLGTYELDLDDDGELITLERTRRFYRSEADHR